jgi:hypothetical protein
MPRRKRHGFGLETIGLPFFQSDLSRTRLIGLRLRPFNSLGEAVLRMATAKPLVTPGL